MLSVDNDAVEEGLSRRGILVEPFAISPERALHAAGLEGTGEIVKGDAFTVEVEPGAYDLVLLDLPLREPESVSRLFERWWPGARRGGRVILRDGREPRNPGVHAFGSTLARRRDLMLEDDPPGRFIIAVNN